MAKNKVTYGLSNGHYAVATANNEGVYTFGEVKKLENLTSFSGSVVGGKTDIYADNKIVATLTSYAGQELTIALTELSDEFKKDVLGYKVDSEGALCEVTNAQSKSFAFGFQMEGDAQARRVWYYLCTATNPGDGSTTKGDSPEANAPEIIFTARPIKVGDDEVLRRIISAGDAGYANFFKSVTIPTFTL